MYHLQVDNVQSHLDSSDTLVQDGTRKISMAGRSRCPEIALLMHHDDDALT